MSFFKYFSIAVLALVSSLALVGLKSLNAAPSAPAHAQNPEAHLIKLKASRAKVQAQLDALPMSASDLLCKSDSDCASAEVGVKPCGGPRSYRVYSKRSAKSPALRKKSAEFNRLDQSLNELEPTMSDCSMTLPPELHCINKVCVDTAAPKAKPFSSPAPSRTAAPKM